MGQQMEQKSVLEMAKRAREVSLELMHCSAKDRSEALLLMADSLRTMKTEILKANEADVKEARAEGLSGPMVKRLTVDEKLFKYMVSRMEKVADLPDPVGRILQGHTEPSGLKVEKISVPIGVIAMIYESRPNVTTDAASVCLKSGNAVVLRGGSESLRTNKAIMLALSSALEKSRIPQDSIQMLLTKNHADVDTLLEQDEYIDVLIPRGGKPLIKAVTEKSSIPVLKHYDGICHLYIAEDANEEEAIALAVNSKTQKVEVCNALETLLIDSKIAPSILPNLKASFDEKKVELRGCQKTRELLPQISPADEMDWETEYLAPILSVKIVSNQQEAHDHIAHYGSGHTDAIATQSIRRAEDFVNAVDSSSIMINASTRLSGGNDYGQGAVIGISTNKLHARGPVGPEDLTTYKWIARGNGHLRQ